MDYHSFFFLILIIHKLLLRLKINWLLKLIQQIEMDSSNLTIQNEELCLANFKFESCNELLRSFITVKDMLYQFEIQLKTSFVKLQCNRGGSYQDRL